jgi:hypothetical protein
MRSGRYARRGTDPGGRIPVGHRRVLPDSQERDRAGPRPGPPLRRLVPAHHPRHPGARLPGRHGGEGPKSPGSGLIAVTLGEIRRLLAHLITVIPCRTAAWHCSHWRRTHQCRARTSHYQRRQSRYNEVLLSTNTPATLRDLAVWGSLAGMPKAARFLADCWRGVRCRRFWDVASRAAC